MIFIVSFIMLLRPVMPVIEYAANYQYISKVRCVNKANPALHCNGKCHLMKELAKASNNETPVSPDKRNSNTEQELLFLQEITAFCILRNFQNARQENYGYNNLYSHPELCSAFRPPAFIS